MFSKIRQKNGRTNSTWYFNMASSVFAFGTIQSLLQQMLQMLIKLPCLPTLPITWDALSTSVPSAALSYGQHWSCFHRVKPSTGNWSKIREAVVSEPVTGIFLPSEPVPFLLYWADHTFHTRMCWSHPETKGHIGLIHRVERLPFEKDSSGGDRREGKETNYQQEPRWIELKTGSPGIQKGHVFKLRKSVAAFPAMGLAI